MPISELLLDALRPDNVWPMLALSLLAYPIYVTFDFTGAQIARLCVMAVRIIFGVRPSVIDGFRRIIVGGSIHSVGEAKEMESKIRHVERQVERILLMMERFGGFLDSERMEGELDVLRATSNELRALRYQVALFDKNSAAFEPAAVGLETYLSKGFIFNMSVAYAENLIAIGQGIDHPLVQRNVVPLIEMVLGPMGLVRIRARASALAH